VEDFFEVLLLVVVVVVVVVEGGKFIGLVLSNPAVHGR
jgi:hypothetical protein